MKFEIDPNELTTDQRAHVAAFITNWPVVKLDAHKVRATEELDFEPTEEQVLGYAQGMEFYITEERRLDAEQKSDLSASAIDTAGDLTMTFTATQNLNNIFGEPKSSAVPLDAQGLPWDSRIHASTKTFIADGTWKLRRGVDPTEVATVKAQLKELMAVPQALVTDLHRGVATVPADDIVHSTGHVDYDPSSRIPVPPAPGIIPELVEIVPPIPGYVVPQAQVERASEVNVVEQYAARATVTLTDLIGRMSAAIAAGKLTQANVTEMCAKHGVSEFMLLSSRPDLLPPIDADMKAMGV